MSRKTKVAFVDFSNNFFDRHSIYCLSAYLKKKGIQTHYVNNSNFAKAIVKIKKISPELLLYSAFSRDIPDFVKFDKIIKQNLAVKSIIGGVGPTFERDFLNQCTIDALCIGEGEQALVEFIEHGFSPIKNIINHQNNTPSDFFPFLDIDNTPFSDRDLVYRDDYVLRNMPNKQFLAGRGCPYMCTYCHNNIQNKLFKHCGPIVRKKSVSYLLEEIKQVRSEYPLKLVVFQDDTFILEKKWLFEFFERYPKEIGLPYTCNIRANLVDEAMVVGLKQSNCVCTYWSIESGNDYIRNNLLKRAMSRTQILQTAQLLNKYKIPHRNGGMLGLPGETASQMLETLELNIKTKPVFGFASIFVPYPSLELTNYALKHDYLSAELLANLPNNTHLHSVLNFTAPEKLFIQKLTYLYPIFVNFPHLFYNRRAYDILFKLPRVLLYLLFNLFSVFKMIKLYKVKTALPLKMAIIWRYLKNPF